ncbi:NUDIX domain-containing protein [Bacillus sp. Bva_UNVM-123]|uniref:NUDIX hydrolase n=1 Tax=Bacillus sp. Bva_UNVM-123 TaxID=2829798 RepID=UPI00391F0046
MNNQNKLIVGVKAVILHNGKVLLIKRAHKAHIDGGTWEPVGGKLEFGEDIESALRREIREEVGLHVKIERILYATTFKTDPSRQVVILTYLCESDKNDVLLSNEHEDFQWSTKAQLKQLLPQKIIDDFEENGVFSLTEILE